MSIAAWLQEIGLGEYGEIFRANAIDLEILPDLTESDLEKLGVLLGQGVSHFGLDADGNYLATVLSFFAQDARFTPPYHYVHSLASIDRATLNEILSMDPHASLQFLNLLCRMISRRLREINEKIVQWKYMSGGF